MKVLTTKSLTVSIFVLTFAAMIKIAGVKSNDKINFKEFVDFFYKADWFLIYLPVELTYNYAFYPCHVVCQIQTLLLINMAIKFKPIPISLPLQH